MPTKHSVFKKAGSIKIGELHIGLHKPTGETFLPTKFNKYNCYMVIQKPQTYT